MSVTALRRALESVHLASFRRQISMNCLISETSRGMVDESVGVIEEEWLSLARRCGCRLPDMSWTWNFGGRLKRGGIFV